MALTITRPNKSHVHRSRSLVPKRLSIRKGRARGTAALRAARAIVQLSKEP